MASDETPTGTIFELDMFRERLARQSAAYHDKRFPSMVTSSAVGREFAERAAELKTLIDNVMAQYCPTGKEPND